MQNLRYILVLKNPSAEAQVRIIIFFSTVFFSLSYPFFLSFLSCLCIVVYVRENVKNYVALSEGELVKKFN